MGPASGDSPLGVVTAAAQLLRPVPDADWFVYCAACGVIFLCGGIVRPCGFLVLQCTEHTCNDAVVGTIKDTITYACTGWVS